MLRIKLLNRLFSSKALRQEDITQSTLKQQIQRDMLAAMRCRDTERASTLRLAYAELIKSEKSPTPLAEILVLHRYVQRFESAIEEYRRLQKGCTGDQCEKLRRTIEREESEVCIIKSYLPVPYSDNELLQAINLATSELDLTIPTAARVGLVMQKVLATLDASRVNKKALAMMVSKALQ
jgi:uncharacterized protein YqeY